MKKIRGDLNLDYNAENLPVWTDDKQRQNEIVYQEAGAKIEKISQSLDLIENDLDTSTGSHFLITSLRGLTKELQDIISERTRKINFLESQCERQQLMIDSHRDENEYVLERIDHAMRELENTITEQYKKIDQLDKNSVAQQLLVENYKKERILNLGKIESLEKSLVAITNEKNKLIEKVESTNVFHKDNKEALVERIMHLQMDVDRQKGDKDLLLERIVNLEVELDDLMKNHKEEKYNLVERINELEVMLHDAESCGNSSIKSINTTNNMKNSIKNCSSNNSIINTNRFGNNNSNNNKIENITNHVKNHETDQIRKEKQKKAEAIIGEIKSKRAVAVEKVQNGKYASKGVAINVIHNMLHKDKLAKLI